MPKRGGAQGAVPSKRPLAACVAGMCAPALASMPANAPSSRSIAATIGDLRGKRTRVYVETTAQETRAAHLLSFGYAPALSSSAATWRWPWRQASSSGVLAALSCTFVLAPCLSKHSTAGTMPTYTPTESESESERESQRERERERERPPTPRAARWRASCRVPAPGNRSISHVPYVCRRDRGEGLLMRCTGGPRTLAPRICSTLSMFSTSPSVLPSCAS